MSGLSLLLALMLTRPASEPPQDTASADRDNAAIVQAALDYADGFYEGAADRMTRAVSLLLTKRGLLNRPPVAPYLVQMNAEMLIEATRRGSGKTPPEKRGITTEVLAVDGEVASARVFSTGFNDYLHLMKRDGEWRLVSVLWHPPVPAPSGADVDKGVVEQAVKDLVTGLSTADASRVQALLHPLVAWRHLAPTPTGRRIVVDENVDSILAGMSRFQGLRVKPEETRAVVLGIDHDIASAKVTLGPMPVYLHLAKQNGQWRIVNVLDYLPEPAAAPR